MKSDLLQDQGHVRIHTYVHHHIHTYQPMYVCMYVLWDQSNNSLRSSSITTGMTVWFTHQVCLPRLLTGCTVEGEDGVDRGDGVDRDGGADRDGGVDLDIHRRFHI